MVSGEVDVLNSIINNSRTYNLCRFYDALSGVSRMSTLADALNVCVRRVVCDDDDIHSALLCAFSGNSTSFSREKPGLRVYFPFSATFSHGRASWDPSLWSLLQRFPITQLGHFSSYCRTFSDTRPSSSAPLKLRAKASDVSKF